jgi:hypothetical protein
MGHHACRAKGSMWAVRVVVVDVDAKYRFEMAATADEDPVEAVSPDGAHEAFGVGVGLLGTDGCADDCPAFAAEDLVEGAGELRVAVSDEEPASA